MNPILGWTIIGVIGLGFVALFYFLFYSAGFLWVAEGSGNWLWRIVSSFILLGFFVVTLVLYSPDNYVIVTIFYCLCSVAELLNLIYCLLSQRWKIKLHRVWYRLVAGVTNVTGLFKLRLISNHLRDMRDDLITEYAMLLGVREDQIIF